MRNIKAIDLIKKVKELVEGDEVSDGKELRVNFILMPPESVCDGDQMDVSLDFEGIDTSSISYDDPYVDMAFKVTTITDGKEKFNCSPMRDAHVLHEEEFWKRLVENKWADLEDFEKEDYSRENMKHIDDSIMVSLFDIRDALNTESLGLTYEQKRDIFHVLNEWKENEMECE